MSKMNRAFELDFLRGFSLFLMILMHFAYDIRYFFGIDTFGFLESKWFWSFVEPFFLCIFVGVSGICCSFSRSNLKRGLKLLVVAILFSIGTYLAKTFFSLDCLILFNVLHMLSVSILVYSLIVYLEKKWEVDFKITNALMSFFGVWIIAMGEKISDMDGVIDGPWLIPFGIIGKNSFFMADYMALIPWLGVFLIGAVVGRVCYANKTSLITNPPKALLKINKPFSFLGRHSLIIYIIHQPIVMALTYVVLWGFGKV